MKIFVAQSVAVLNTSKSQEVMVYLGQGAAPGLITVFALDAV